MTEQDWHEEILPSNSHTVLAELQDRIKLPDFYLAGGTGLALFLGHRLSRDFDFFSSRQFDENSLIQKLSGLDEIVIVSKSEHTLHITLKTLKVSFLGYTYSLLYPVQKYQPDKGKISIDVADIRDIACMKISAISSMGTKRDFVDLYFAAQHYTIQDLFQMFRQKFSLTPYNNVHILKSLTYFDDAEDDPMPDMLIQTSWESIKQFFNSEVPKLL